MRVATGRRDLATSHFSKWETPHHLLSFFSSFEAQLWGGCLTLRPLIGFKLPEPKKTLIAFFSQELKKNWNDSVAPFFFVPLVLWSDSEKKPSFGLILVPSSLRRPIDRIAQRERKRESEWESWDINHWGSRQTVQLGDLVALKKVPKNDPFVQQPGVH